MKDQQGGQFFYAKAFDNFAPIGPALISPEYFAEITKDGTARLQAKVNGQVLQDTDCATDMVFPPAKILSHMSQGSFRLSSPHLLFHLSREFFRPPG
jgi:2-keto-4-pentenoate hydratase/2-oxohepta-3-ene-1,7-dioic acid hydratase in catechol pathway